MNHVCKATSLTEPSSGDGLLLLRRKAPLSRRSVAYFCSGAHTKFKALSERLDALKERFESGQMNSVEFLKQLLVIAKETLQAEKEIPPEEDEDRGKAALTDLFNEIKTDETPIMVERVVKDIDEIVRLVRFPGWQNTLAGEREVKKALRKALFKYKLHADEELFEKAYSYIRQYY
jgi:type I restriction enzyme R subunit